MSQTRISEILGNLFLLLGEIHPTEMPKLMGAMADTGIPMGRLLVICQRLTEDELQSALRAAQAVLSGELSINRAAIFLAYSYFWHLPFEMVRQRIDFKKSSTVAMLLIAAGLLHTRNVIELAKDNANGNNISGLELYKAGLITLEQWRTTIGLAVQVQHQETNLRQALYEPEDVNATADLPVVETNEEERKRLGDLLLQAGLVAEEELLTALETSLESGEMLGEVLLFEHIITSFELTAALKLQSLIHEESLTWAEAITWLKQIPVSQGLQLTLGSAA